MSIDLNIILIFGDNLVAGTHNITYISIIKSKCTHLDALIDTFDLIVVSTHK